MTLKVTKLLAFILFMGMPFLANAQNGPDLTDALNHQLIPLRTVEPDTGFADLEPLKAILKDKQIFGLGEATHGTHEFFTFKHRMLVLLVKELGVKTFVIEGDFAGAQQMNDYVLYGKNSLNQGLVGLGIRAWMTQEVADMAEWIKTYNDTQTPENKVTFWGCDLKLAYFMVEPVKQYLTANHQLTPVLDSGFSAMRKYGHPLTETDKASVKAALGELSKISFNKADPGKLALYQHYVRQMQQCFDYVGAYSKLFPARQDNVRDKYMAENCEWIYNQTGHKKMMIWAHNQHICKSSGSEGHNRMGMRLAKTFGEAYYAVGFDFYDGAMRSFDMQTMKYVAVPIAPAKADATGNVFSKCSAANFILDFKSASANPVIKNFLDKEVPSSFYGAEYNAPSYVEHRLADSYDGVIFIKNTTPARSLKPSQQ
ncbi:erythromycin esterase [Mucilaginibacter yixingensis]|uniref:Erythromycin esterase n=1 Tax=Mucilaginibacter yixingensis TaxID=1295612 RepID=A0A2T5J6E6_9SPHI|nr:erythromycin esterase family protein [Mucilaginibacter yixingensis]PTQ94110.1 erythromycin esterase [Mucilaginibacter yixingensis]